MVSSFSEGEGTLLTRQLWADLSTQYYSYKEEIICAPANQDRFQESCGIYHFLKGLRA